MKVLEYMARYGYEQVLLCHDAGVGFTAIIAVHDTTLGPALGGVRVWDYQSEDDAILDALRLARAMTFKSAAAGLNLGGGKAVVVGVPRPGQREAVFRSLGRFIESLGGRYIATEDVGTSLRDMEHISLETSHVSGLPVAMGGSGDPSPVTAFGLYHAMRACVEDVSGSPSLKGMRVVVQGVGKVGYNLLPYLVKDGASLAISDIREGLAQQVAAEFNARVVPPDKIYDEECDIFSPCALGAVLNKRTIPRLKCRMVCGAANNQLEELEDGSLLEGRGILYAPDFIANAGGVINISVEFT
ncbi:MAG: Glu/Leu/Phe/Val dehydrogenase dimerization domain-containing protein, partial [Chloroflexota bacterium]